MSKAGKAFVGLCFLTVAVVMSVIFACMVLKPTAAASGYDAAKGLAIGVGVGGIVAYFVLRFLANRTSGCLFRMVFKLLAFVLYALGIGLLFTTFLLEDPFKSLLGVKDKASEVRVEDASLQ